MLSDTSDPLEGTSSPTKINVGPVSIEATLPRWAIALLSVIILAGLTGTGLYFGLKKVREVENQALREQQALKAKALKEIEEAKNSVSVPLDDMAVYQEETKHSTDRPQNKEDIQKDLHQDGSIMIHHYYSDGCVHVVRYDSSGGVADQKWIFGPHHHFNPKDAPKPATSAQISKFGSEVNASLPLDTETLEAGGLREAVFNVLKESVTSKNISSQGRLLRTGYFGCLDPHPGTFTFQNQPINQCLIQVNRFFPDGCAHYQLYNPCNGMWDVWPNGAAKVTWVRCVH